MFITKRKIRRILSDRIDELRKAIKAMESESKSAKVSIRYSDKIVVELDDDEIKEFVNDFTDSLLERIEECQYILDRINDGR